MKRFYKSSKNKVFFGVAGGIAEYFDVDPVIIRIAFILLTIFHGSGILIYIICAIVMPKDYMLNFQNYQSSFNNSQPFQTSVQNETLEKKSNRDILLGSILVGLGIIFLLHNIIPRWGFEDIFPLGLILFGGWLIFSSVKKEEIVK